VVTRHRAVLPVVLATVLALVLTGLAEVGRLAAAAGSDPPQLSVPSSPIRPGATGVGYLPGSWAVSPTGRFQYTLPLDVPAGRAGVQPDLALVYSSGTSDGTLGVGWALSGASSRLSWCGSSRSTENTTSGVRLDGTDRLCLDGAKLVAVSGTYGAGGTRYRTELDSFAEVVSGPAGEQGPENFTVRTKDGRVRFYESVSATRRERAVALRGTGPAEAELAASTRRVMWLLASEEDRSGNRMRFEYANVSSPPATPEVELRFIRYTSRGAEPAHRVVELHYQNRPDPTSVFQAGVRFDSTQRISSITMHAPNPATTQLVWRYDLGYIQSGAGRSLLNSVTRCAPSGSCLRAKSFAWNQHGAVPAFTRVDLGPVPIDVSTPASPGMHVADLNGDGASDALYNLGGAAATNSVRVRLSTRTASGGIAPLSEYHDTADLTWPITVNFAASRPLDVDGDGRHEFLTNYPLGSNGGINQALRWNGTTHDFEPTGTVLASPSPLNFADMNGDGLSDMVTADVPQADDGQPDPVDPDDPQPPQPTLYNYSVRLNTGSGFGPAVSSTLAATARRSVVRTTDTDGDGRSELTIGSYQVRADDSGAVSGRPGTTSANGDTWYRVPPLDGIVDQKWNQYQLVDGDFNGDGLTDWLLLPKQTNLPATLLWNTGNGLTIAPATVDIPRDQFNDVRSADVDGDGRDDLVSFHAMTSVLTSRGDGRFALWHIAGDGGVAHPYGGHVMSRLGDFDGDGRLDAVRVSGGRLVVLQQNPSAGDRIVSVTDQGTNWPAQTVTYSTTYGDAPDTTTCVYPQVCLRGGMMVVRQVDSRAELVDPVNAARPARSFRYAYQDPRADLRGRGFLGFGTMLRWDAARPQLTLTTHDHATRADDRLYPFAGRPKTVTTVVPILTQEQLGQQPATATARVVRTDTTPELRRLNGNRSYAVFAGSSVTKEWEQQVGVDWSAGRVSGVAEPATVLRTSSASGTYDDYGNRTRATASTALGVTEQVQTDQDNRPGDWLITLPTTHTVTRTEAGGVTTTRRGARHYDQLGRLDAEHTEPGNPDPDVRTSTAYALDQYGLVRTATATTPGQRPRVSHSEYEPLFPGQPDEQVFVSRVWSDHSVPEYAPSHWTAVHPAYGVTVASMDTNGVQTTTWFDDQARPVRVEQDGLAASTMSYANRTDLAGGSNGSVVATTVGPQATRAVTDALGRTLSSSATGFDGTPAVTTTRRDTLGRVVSTTAPAPTGTARATFDSLDRQLTATAPDGATTTNTHTFATTATVDPVGARTESRRDPDGRTIATVRYLQSPGRRSVALTTRYTYKPFDLVATVTDPGNNVTSYDYDVHGRPVRTVDPDRGATATTYFGSGQIDTETHEATGDATRFTYDDLGRTESTTTRDGVSTFTYDTAAHGIGKLASSVGPDRVRVDHSYDENGNSTGDTYTDESTGTTYGVQRRYTTSGQLDSIVYPAGFTVRYEYNQHGHLRTVNDVSNPAAPARLWQVDSRNPNQSLATAKLGPFTLSNAYQPGTGRLTGRTVTDPAAGAGGPRLQDLGYTYHANGLVATRTDAVNGRAESFGFDSLSRLTRWQLGTGSAPTVTGYGYDSIGNLAEVTRDGQVVQRRGFGRADGTQPHTLTGLTPAGGATQVSDYDDKGRQTGGNGRVVTYTNTDLPRTVVRGGVTTRYTYDANGRKAKEAAPSGTTYYLPGVYERRETASGTAHVYHLGTPDGPIGQVVRTASTTTTEYATTDHLGSITASVMAGATGAATGVRQLFYEPFGARVNADGTSFTGYTGALTRGFTGHEHTPAVGLINMNGRVYDPDQRAFLSTDPLNRAGDNPFAYVGHSPLNHTDPSGYQPKDAVEHWRDGQAQSEFEEFAAAGQAYQYGGIPALKDHMLGALFRGVAAYNRAVDTDRRLAAEAARSDAVRFAAATATAFVATLGLSATPVSPFTGELDRTVQALTTPDLRNVAAGALMALALATMPDNRLAQGEDPAGVATKNLKDKNFRNGQVIGAAVGLAVTGAIVLAGEAVAAMLTACARFVVGCVAGTGLVGNRFDVPSAERTLGPVTDAVADAVPPTLRSPEFPGTVVDHVPDVQVVAPAPYLAPMAGSTDVLSGGLDVFQPTLSPLQVATRQRFEAIEALNMAYMWGDLERAQRAAEQYHAAEVALEAIEAQQRR
jgi:RHS repeat-associated protein